MRYLYAWGLELVGRSGAGATGSAGLTWTTLRDWAHAERGGEMPSGRECRALMRLDSALRGALPADKTQSTDIVPPWPDKKRA